MSKQLLSKKNQKGNKSVSICVKRSKGWSGNKINELVEQTNLRSIQLIFPNDFDWRAIRK